MATGNTKDERTIKPDPYTSASTLNKPTIFTAMLYKSLYLQQLMLNEFALFARQCYNKVST